MLNTAIFCLPVPRGDKTKNPMRADLGGALKGDSMKSAIVCSALLSLVSLPVLAQGAKPACHGACLQGYLDHYLNAMLAHAFSAELFARDTKAVNSRGVLK
jgi:hypothetical protein